MTVNYDRSLVFTALLQEREVASMESMRGMRVVSDAMEALENARRENPGVTLAEAMDGYVRAVTANHTADPGVWERYCDALLAGDEVKAREANVLGLPKGVRMIGLLEGSSRIL